MADQVGAQRVAVAFTTGFCQDGTDIGIEFAQLPFAGVRDVHAEAIGRNLGFDFLVFHQAQAGPVGTHGAACRQMCRRMRLLVWRLKRRPFAVYIGRARRNFTQHALVVGFVEGQCEHRRLAVQLELRTQQAVALEGIVGGQCRQPQAFDGALCGFTR